MKNTILILCLSTMLLMASSCEHFLDIEPVSSVTDENFWKTQTDADAAVASLYALLRTSLNHAEGVSFYAYGDLPSDEFTSAVYYPFHQVTTMQWNLGVAASETGNPMYRLRRYDQFYRVVDQANRIIKNLPTMDPSVFDTQTIRNHLLGEAYFVRAFAYFYMSRIWGGVPLVLDVVAPVDAQNHSAASANEVLAQCLSDISAAKELLQWGNLRSSDFAVRGNLGALLALEAHISAWMGNYERCAIVADSVLQSGRYSFVSRDSALYRNIYKGQSAEGIFEISQNGDDEGTTRGIGYYTLREPYYRIRTDVPFFYIAPSHVTALFDEADDKRLNSVFDLTYGSEYALCTKYANVSYSDETANATAVFKNNIVVFRFSDIKLLLAEALAATGREDEALPHLNEVRVQAGLQAWDQDGDLIKEIFDERARELFLEGHRYYDMIRLMRNFNRFEFPASKMTSAQFNAGKYLWPFDPSLLDSNPLLYQTPYWATVNM